MSIFKYGLVAITQCEDDCTKGLATVVHFCGYMSPPTKDDIKALEYELDTVPEFELVGRINDDVFIIEASPEMVLYYTGEGIKNKTITIHEEK